MIEYVRSISISIYNKISMLNKKRKKKRIIIVRVRLDRIWIDYNYINIDR